VKFDISFEYSQLLGVFSSLDVIGSDRFLLFKVDLVLEILLKLGLSQEFDLIFEILNFLGFFWAH
jgi:hypothetical protein